MTQQLYHSSLYAVDDIGDLFAIIIGCHRWHSGKADEERLEYSLIPVGARIRRYTFSTQTYPTYEAALAAFRELTSRGLEDYGFVVLPRYGIAFRPDRLLACGIGEADSDRGVIHPYLWLASATCEEGYGRHNAFRSRTEAEVAHMALVAAIKDHLRPDAPTAYTRMLAWLKKISPIRLRRF